LEPRRRIEGHRWATAIATGAVFAGIILYIWWLRGVYSPSWLVILAFIVVSHWIRREGPVELGFRFSGLKSSLFAVLPVLILLILGLLAFGSLFRTIRSVTFERAVSNLAIYLVWGLFQQYLLNGYFVNRLRFVFPAGEGKWAALLASVLFATAHVPNLFLMLVALTGGYSCARLYLKYRNLLLLGILHGTVGFTLHLVLPGSITHYFLAGPGYFTR
jgi:hypothetical protein